jgi:WD40 repeat protein
VLSPQLQQQQQHAQAAVPTVAAPRTVQVQEPKVGENVTPNVVNDTDNAEKNVPVEQQQQQITLRRSSRAKRNSPVLSSVDLGGSGSGGSESDSHTPRTSDADIGKTDNPVSVHVQGHTGPANAVAWTSGSEFISVGGDGIARVWDASGGKLSAKCSFQGECGGRALS